MFSGQETPRQQIDVFAALRYAMNVTLSFYEVEHRPYVPWIFGNLREFLPNNGVFSTLLVVLSLGWPVIVVALVGLADGLLDLRKTNKPNSNLPPNKPN